jgi:Rod binding domain-containing protein
MHVSSSAAAASSQRPPVPERLLRAAQDFESLLLASLWKTLQNDPLTQEDDSGPTMTDWGIEVAAQQLARAGGIGIGRMVLEQLERSIKVSSGAADSENRQTGSRAVPEKLPEIFRPEGSAGVAQGEVQ